MTDKLDKLLNDYDDKSKKAKEEHKKFEEELKAKKDAFNSGFGDLMAKTIRPTMTKLLAKIREHGHNAQIHDDKQSKHFAYVHENYLINRGKGGGNYALVSVVGNHDHQKVFIYTHYSEGSAYKEIENKYDLTEITSTLLTDILTDAASKVIK